MSLNENKPNGHPNTNKNKRKINPLRPQRNFREYGKFLAIAVIFVILIDFAVFRGERPYITQMKQNYYAEKAAEEAALNEALPAKVIFPENGDIYFQDEEERPAALELKDEQSMLPEKELKIELLTEQADKKVEVAKIEQKPKPEPKAIEAAPKPKPKVVKKFTGGKKKIAIVIDDVGMNLRQSRAAIDLPAEVTLAMLPYAETVRSMAKKAKADGHELIIHTPMEAMNKDVPLGSMALYTGMSDAEFKAEFDKISKSFEGYVGVNNHMGSRLTQDSVEMKRVMAELKKRGLYFLDSKTIGSSVAASTAQSYGVPNITRDVFLDHEDTPEFLQSALKKTENVANKHGYAIAIGHPKQNTMSALRAWIPTLEARGYELVPLSELIDGVPKKKVSAKKTIKKVAFVESDSSSASTGQPVPLQPSQVEPSAGGEFVDLVGELSPEDEAMALKPIEVQNAETGSFVVRRPTKEIIMERGLPSVSYPVE